MKKQNTYSLVQSSQEKGRGIFEGVVLALVVLCTVFTVGQFATHSIVTPGMNRVTKNSSPVTVEVLAYATPPPAPAPIVASN